MIVPPLCSARTGRRCSHGGEGVSGFPWTARGGSHSALRRIFFCKRGLQTCAKIYCSITAPTRVYSHSGAHRGANTTSSGARRLSGRRAVEPLACVSAAGRERPRAGDTLRSSTGPIGLMFVSGQLYGCRVIAIGRARRNWIAPRPGRRRFGHRGDQSDPWRGPRHDSQSRVDIAIEAVGKPQTWEWPPTWPPRGTVNFFGGCPTTAACIWIRRCCITPKSPAKPASTIRRVHPQGWNWFARPHRASFSSIARTLANLLEVMRHLMSHTAPQTRSFLGAGEPCLFRHRVCPVA